MYAYKHSHYRKAPGQQGEGEEVGRQSTTASLESSHTWSISLCPASTALWERNKHCIWVAISWEKRHCKARDEEILRDPVFFTSVPPVPQAQQRGKANSERPEGTGTVQTLASTSTTCPGSSFLTGQRSGLLKSRDSTVGQLEVSMVKVLCALPSISTAVG